MYALVRAGDVLAGKYQVERVLGMGGMGVVVAATHLHLREQVAIKLLLPNLVEHPETLARFLREARAAARVKSPHVTRVFDFGTLESGAPFIVMELLEGVSMSAMIRRGGKLPAAVAAEYGMQACEAMAEAHAAGIVHRDLKPANLFVCLEADGRPLLKVLDFGVSKMIEPDASHDMTATASLLGSPSYMAPEQMLSAKNVDARADIWSMGAILYELATGEKPFRADTVPALCMTILNAEPRRPSELAPDLPPEFERVILRCLAKAKEDRFDSAHDLADALAPFVEGPREAREPGKRGAAIEHLAQSLGAGETAGETRPGSAAEATAAGVSSDGITQPRRTLALGTAAGALLLLALVAGGTMMARKAGAPAVSAATTQAEAGPIVTPAAAASSARTEAAVTTAAVEAPPPPAEPPPSASAPAARSAAPRSRPAPRPAAPRAKPPNAGLWSERKW
jgi:eukaryotic-like serine/threonine-protein kinase